MSGRLHHDEPTGPHKSFAFYYFHLPSRNSSWQYDLAFDNPNYKCTRRVKLVDIRSLKYFKFLKNYIIEVVNIFKKVELNKTVEHLSHELNVLNDFYKQTHVVFFLVFTKIQIINLQCCFVMDQIAVASGHSSCMCHILMIIQREACHKL